MFNNFWKYFLYMRGNVTDNLLPLQIALHMYQSWCLTDQLPEFPHPRCTWQLPQMHSPRKHHLWKDLHQQVHFLHVSERSTEHVSHRDNVYLSYITYYCSYDRSILKNQALTNDLSVILNLTHSVNMDTYIKHIRECRVVLDAHSILKRNDNQQC